MKPYNIIKRIKPAAAALLVLISSAVLVSCSPKNGQTLRVGVKTDVPGFGYYNEIDNIYSGLEIDLARMLSREMGYGRTEFVPVTSSNRLVTLTEDRADIIIATFTVTPERMKDFVFTSPYYSSALCVMVQKSSLFVSLDDLCGRTIGVAPGSSAAQELAMYMAATGRIPAFDPSGFTPEHFDSGIQFKVMDYPALSNELDKGTIDAICTDSSILKGYMNNERLIIEESFCAQEYAAAVLPGSPIADSVCSAMTRLHNDGSINALLKKWE